MQRYVAWRVRRVREGDQAYRDTVDKEPLEILAHSESSAKYQATRALPVEDKRWVAQTFYATTDNITYQGWAKGMPEHFDTLLFLTSSEFFEIDEK